MRYFICALGEISLGIPAEQVEHIIPADKTLADKTPADENETGNDAVKIFLPELFGQKAETPHGLILKTGNQNKKILLTPRIEIDLEIPDEKIKKLPESFTGIYSCFTGACFADSGKMIFIINAEKITENYND